MSSAKSGIGPSLSDNLPRWRGCGNLPSWVLARNPERPREAPALSAVGLTPRAHLQPECERRRWARTGAGAGRWAGDAQPSITPVVLTRTRQSAVYAVLGRNECMVTCSPNSRAFDLQPDWTLLPLGGICLVSNILFSTSSQRVISTR